MRKLIISALAIVAMAGCQKQENSDVSQSVAVNFSSAALDTRLSDSGSEWTTGDGIGIYMTDEGVTSSFTRSNVLYTALTGGLSTTKFAVDDQHEPILYPYSGNVDFYAYYPYKEYLVDCYTVDIINQTTAPDLMFASYSGANKNIDEVEFDFEHKLSKLQLVISSRQDIATLEDIEVSICGVSTQIDYDIITGEQRGATLVQYREGEEIPLVVSENVLDGENNVAGVVVSAILIPEVVESGTICIYVDSRIFYLDISENTEFTAGNIHRYYISIGEDYADFEGDSDIITWGDGEEDADTIFSDFILELGFIS